MTMIVNGAAKWIARNALDAAFISPSFPLRHVSRLLNRKYHSVKIRGAGWVHFRPDSSDAETFIQVFRNRQYDLSFRPGQFKRIATAYQRMLEAGRIPLILDAGANVGAASIWFARLFPEAVVLAIEPDAGNAEVCRLNTGRFENVKVVEAALGPESGRVSLRNPTNQAWAVQTVRDDGGTVAMRTISDLAGEVSGAKLFIVKMDIEGFEADLFATNIHWLDDTEVVIVEPHDWLLPGQRTSRSFQKAIGDRDFEILISGENLIFVRNPCDRAGD